MHQGRDTAIGSGMLNSFPRNGSPFRLSWLATQRRSPMPLYLTRFSYTPATWARLVANPEDRRAAATQYIEAVGGTLQGFWYAFGEHDAYALYEAPDNVAMAAKFARYHCRGSTQLDGDHCPAYGRGDADRPPAGRFDHVSSSGQRGIERAGRSKPKRYQPGDQDARPSRLSITSSMYTTSERYSRCVIVQFRVAGAFRCLVAVPCQIAQPFLRHPQRVDPAGTEFRRRG